MIAALAALAFLLLMAGSKKGGDLTGPKAPPPLPDLSDAANKEIAALNAKNPTTAMAVGMAIAQSQPASNVWINPGRLAQMSMGLAADYPTLAAYLMTLFAALTVKTDGKSGKEWTLWSSPLLDPKTNSPIPDAFRVDVMDGVETLITYTQKGADKNTRQMVAAMDVTQRLDKDRMGQLIMQAQSDFGFTPGPGMSAFNAPKTSSASV